ncbi:type VII toxin-antitoxin system HepT family RNase toxin [Actinomycetospora sp. CA-084318]|uniref:type VII toxin-antitoxin system HepT family RNase toxin n=1 Tax=Actinomycetospora sp. CA-084318 TaxID=3239892 RepID=UPI003D979C12
MTPRRLDWHSVHPKLRQIERFAGVLVSFDPVTAADLDADIRTALAVERALTLLVELAFAVNAHVAAAVLGRSPDSYAESFALAAEVGAIDAALAARLRPSAGMRNVLVHAYLEVDHEIVAASLPSAVTDYTEYSRQVARWFATSG